MAGQGITGFLRAIREVPRWAGAMTLEEYRTFLGLVDADLTRRDLLPYRFDDGVVVLMGAHRGETLGLENLAAVCRTTDRAGWAATVGAYFDHITRSNAAVAELLAAANDFDKVRDRLRVRLHAEDSPVLADGDGVVHRLLARGLRAVLAYDLGETVVSVLPDHARRWGRSLDDLLAVARANVAERVAVEPAVLEAGPGLPVVTLWGSSNSASSHALVLDRHITPPAVYGALVVVPARHVVAFHAIRARRALEAVTYLAGLAALMQSNEPGPISREVYWWHAGGLTHLPTERRGRVTVLAPPQAFLDAVVTPLTTDA